ncbi:MAG: N-acetylornithine carbamoyltransferase [Planctomycetota bacterium]
MNPHGFYHLAEHETREIERLVVRAFELRAGAAPHRFEGKALGLLFFNPSLRTQASFQRAAARLGVDLVQLQSGGNGVWGIECEDGAVMDGANAEHAREAAAVLGRYVDVLAIRAFAEVSSLQRDLRDPLINAFRRFAGVPVVNMESALWHPCQALADWATLDQYAVPRRAKLVLAWAWHPKPLPHAVPNSTVCMAAQRGMDVVVLRPRGYDLHPGVMAEAHSLARAAGGSVTVTDDREAWLSGAAVVYAKSWASLETWGNAAGEARLRAPLRDWCVSASWMERTNHALFMHCLPVRRNVVVRDEVLDGPWSIVVDQAENRLHTQTALLEALFMDLEHHPKTRANPRTALETTP